MRLDCAAIQEVSLVLIRDGKVCLLRRANTGYQDGRYCFPAGHKEPGETPCVAAAREAQEETGIVVDPATLIHRHTMHRRCTDPVPHERVAYFFTTETWAGEPHNAEEAKCDHLDWFPLEDLPEMVPYMRNALEHIRSGVSFSESAR